MVIKGGCHCEYIHKRGQITVSAYIDANSRKGLKMYPRFLKLWH